MAAAAGYPLRVEGRLDAPLSRWLWLVKWLLVIPHVIVLAFLWAAYVVLSFAAFLAILVTGRYPRGIFEFNVGVLRWTWRVSYYAYGALGTDRYPPFTLAEVEDYPAHLDVAYPEQLSRGLALVKWWLLAIPHYLVVGVLAGGVIWVSGTKAKGAPGLIGVFVAIAAFALLFTGRYPRGLFDLVLGFNRWGLRVAAYAGLMTDEYPPFRLDAGETEPAGTVTMGGGPGPGEPAGGPPPGPSSRRGWTGPAVVSVVIGSIVALISLGMLGVGGLAAFLDGTQRDADGFVSASLPQVRTETYAIVGDAVELEDHGARWIGFDRILGNVRVVVEPATPGDRLFVGIAAFNDVELYLDGVERVIVDDLRGPDVRPSGTGAPTGPPGEEDFWVASSEGTGTRTVTWEPRSGRWSLVVMRADASAGVAASGRVGAELPSLGVLALGLIGAGVLGSALAVLLIALPARAAARPSPAR